MAERSSSASEAPRTVDVTGVRNSTACERHDCHDEPVDPLLPRPLEPTDAGHRAVPSDEALRLLDIAVNFRTDGWPDKAKRFARRALTVFERESRTHHPDSIRARLCLAGVREDLADYARAEADYRCANDILDEWAAG